MSKSNSLEAGSEITIVLPCYNESHRLALSLPEFFAWRKSFQSMNACKVNVFLANDGCTDGTVALAKELAANESNFEICGYERNQGRGAALKLSFALAPKTSLFVMYMDSDLATDLRHVQDVYQLFLKQPHSLLVCGNRYFKGNQLQRPLLRKIWSWGWRTFVSALFLRKLPDSQCGFKAMSSDLVLPVMSPLKIKGFVADIEIILRTWAAGAEIKSININWVEKKGSTIRWSTVFKMLLELKELKLNIRGWLNETKALSKEMNSKSTHAA